MPVDVSELMDTSKLETGVSWGNRPFVADPVGTGKLLVAVLNGRFPDYMAASDAVLSTQKAQEGAVAETGGLQGNKVSLGKILDSTVDFSGNDLSVRDKFKGPNTSELMDALGITLHELVHTRQAKGEPGVQKLALGSDWQDMLKDAAKAGFPSITSAWAGGDKLQEFLATAVAITDMKERDFPVTGKLKSASDALPALKDKYSWLSSYIDAQRRPEIPSLKAAPAENKTIFHSIFNLLTGKGARNGNSTS